MSNKSIKNESIKLKVFENVLKIMQIESSSEKSLLTHLKENFKDKLDKILYEVSYTPAPRHQPFCYPRAQVELILDSVPSVFPYNFNPVKDITEKQKQRAREIAVLGSSRAIRHDEIASIIQKGKLYFIRAYTR